ncbi:hypothetical protein BCR43DRAFT_497609 [Syncephalastrum racemosum]|uniref:Uncharacterized protein n=1 Tax=Syncephalastrum racemosum TaxID=13706 RepID=A0A1X2H2H0_SYNRA|nr:hypothetical protein BCR43DRAFT_497609 [Syncephalastrum racemosum]
MNSASPRANTTTLPSISHLLNSDQLPAFSLSPASPALSGEDARVASPTPPQHQKSPYLQTYSLQHTNQHQHPLSPSQQHESHRHHRRLSLSPLLSPVDTASTYSRSPSRSPIPPMLSPPPLLVDEVDEMQESLPPLQGFDPPAIGTAGSKSSQQQHIAPWSTQQLPSPPQQPEKKLSVPEDVAMRLPPTTQILLSPSGKPILKRRRGRPPTSAREPNHHGNGGWTFLTPTVWDVNRPQEAATATTGSDPNAQRTDADITKMSPPPKQHHESAMSHSMAAFTSSDMDTVLQMPRKKRGRKPKKHIVGNSCFVWREQPPSSRKSTKRL